ncbi:MAG: hypothetical protein Q4G63_03575 [Bacteroidia bacterium]|nr:hypothetical protein [Bacteroidia bacterium]
MAIQNTTRTQRIETYNTLTITSKEKVETLKRKLLTNSIFRLVVFLIAVLFAYFMFTKSVWYAGTLLGAITVFLLLLRRHEKLIIEKNRAESALKIAEDELKAFGHDFSPFDGITEQINPAHDFSFDLDIFGNGSIAQVLNRTALKIGKHKLADILKNPLTEKNTILMRQHAIAELSAKEGFCLNFRITGNLSGDVVSQTKETKSMFAPKNTFKSPSFWKLLTIIIPAIYALFITLSLIGIIEGSWFWTLYTATLAISVIPMKKVNIVWTTFDKKSKMLSAYSQLFEQVEKTNFESKLLQDLQKKIIDKKPASQRIKQLAGYIQNLNSAFAFPVLLIVNPLFLWNVLYTLRIENWLKVNGEKTQDWFSVLAKFDTLISLGTFTANRPEYIFPEISDTFYFTGKSLGHPLIPYGKCVKNDIEISRRPYFMIVTGANMAGKSTYLRTVGVNHLFASIGLPVCADKLTFFPGRLLTNLRTSDSLVNNESYFFAELKRLKMIIERLQSGENGLFIILDEILKGTNSEDKQKGSFALMKRLVKLDGNGIIATHDLALGNLENEFPESIRNFHFDADISGNTLTFTYRLEKGIAQNMNASFLMQTMGIVE